VEWCGPKPNLLTYTMATLEEDAKALQKRVVDLARAGESTELKVVLEEHPEVDVDGYKGGDGLRALYWACTKGHTDCAQLLIDHGADVHAKSFHGYSTLYWAAYWGHLGCVKLLMQHGADVKCHNICNNGFTPLMRSTGGGHLTTAQYLLEQKADVHYRIAEGYYKNQDALHWAMYKQATDRTPGIAFAMLSCNTDAKNVSIYQGYVTAAKRDAHIEHYQHVQAYIDEHHRILNLVLSDEVHLDTRVGRGDNGIYQEPLERTLEYLGLSMSKDQVVNTSIDGEEGVKRALIPGHLLNANHWFHKYAESR
jgi:hypothetical protein